MIYSLSGKLVGRGENYAVIDMSGVALKVFISPRVAQSLPKIGDNIKLSTYLYVRENALDLYGFLSEQERVLFERLNDVTGIGPKSALGILGLAPIEQLVAAINEGRAELLSKASGIGKKTAERITLELKGKLSVGKMASAQALNLLESDAELEETLISLGYTKTQAKDVIAKIDPKITGFKDRLKEALTKRQ